MPWVAVWIKRTKEFYVVQIWFAIRIRVYTDDMSVCDCDCVSLISLLQAVTEDIMEKQD